MSENTIVKTGLIKELVPEYFVEGFHLDPDESVDVELVDPKELLVPERIDLICKLYYIDCIEKGVDTTFAKELYTEHIRAFSGGSFTEPGNEEKNSIEKYFNEFDSLINDIKTNGFDVSRSVVPVGKNNAIIDGSHRTSIAVYYNIPLPVVKLKNAAVSYDCKFFEKMGLARKYLDFMTYQYILMSEKVYVACIWPSVYGHKNYDKIDALVEEYAKVVYKKSISLNYHGLEQLMIHIYMDQKWSGDLDNHFAGIPVKAKPCYKAKSMTQVYVLTGAELDRIVELKSKIRDLFNIENHSVHITDTKSEAEDAAQILLNDNSISLMNNGDPFKFKQFENRFKEFYSKKQNNDDRIVDSEAVLSLYGIKDTDVLGYSTVPWMYDPENYLYYFGIKFVSLKKMKEIKALSGSAFDKKEIKQIIKTEKKAGKRGRPSKEKKSFKRKIAEVLNNSAPGRVMIRAYARIMRRS